MPGIRKTLMANVALKLAHGPETIRDGPRLACAAAQ